ncbi:hydantoinase/oxoprolinase family protein [Bacillus sp. MRMR6]|uniref:hydantoinase/oxoprolinase family protein n=1 Tax=Bacillus sp. MRMR6 TaxID=1928617 RepID=UPI0009514B69|nr:hydantoinase/oxoprolinase family protein [Bacillus sp. MRMR6]OLS40073.1 5-oxoprolinase [Bacillus sp. MRMR6]
MNYRIGVDTGGTFTDVSLMNEQTGEMFITKVPSTPTNPSLAVINAVKQIVTETGIDFEQISFFIHGSTVATNALLEGKGSRTALITTKGFKDVLQIGRQTRPKLYDFRARRSDPLVPRNLRFELDERMDYLGNIIREVDRKEVLQLAEELKANKITSVAICFMHSYINAANEQKVKEILAEALSDLPITLSCEVLPEIKEYERTSTVVANAYVLPKMKFYLGHLKSALNELDIPSSLYIMQSNGGIISAETAMNMPIRTVLSGPAGGVLAGSLVAQNTEFKNIITIDMGGTSLDTALIEKGIPQYTTISDVEGRPIKVPMIDMHTIGSGGGSIAWIDTGGALRVGPHSAGADPGPVCYGKGGTEPTVSDANVILGRLNPDSILGGRMKMDVESARKVVKEKIADPLGITVEEAAEGILKVINANMVRGIRVISVEKGHDPRDFSLMAFGGAGPLHAVDIAREIGSKEVIIPPTPGITCATGMLMADVKHDYVKAFSAPLSEITHDHLNVRINDLIVKARKDLTEEGFSTEASELRASLDLRYLHQAYEITIPLNSLYVTGQIITEAMATFHDTHKNIYGFNRIGEKLEMANIRLVGIGKIKKVKNDHRKAAKALELKPIGKRAVYFETSFYETPVYQRSDLNTETVISGPAIIEQLDSTIIVYPEQTAITTLDGNLIINLSNVEAKEEEQYVLS